MTRRTATPLIAACLLLGACSAAGSGGGPMTVGARALGQAKFSWVTRGGDSAELLAELPDGERYRGTATSISTRSQPGVAFAVGPRRRDTTVIIPTDTKHWMGEIEATLAGDRGQSMRCFLRERRAGLGFEGGASGTCRTSDGREIAALF